MARMKYVQRRSNRFEFRYPLPDDLAGKPFPTPWPEQSKWIVNERTGRFKTELIKALGTNEARIAERAALPLIAEAHGLVDLARKALIEGPPSSIAPAEIQQLAAQHEVKLLRSDEALRARGTGLDLQRASVEPDGHGMTDDDAELYRRAIDQLDQVSRKQAMTTRGGEALQLAVNKAVADAGLVLAPDDPAWRELEMAFIRSQQRAIKGISDRLNGEDVPSPALVAHANRHTLSEATKRWASGGGPSARRPREISIAEAQRAVQRFIEMFGDLDMSTITKAQARQYRDAIAKVPKRLPHKLAKLPLPELLKRDLSAYEPRNAQTVNKNLNLISGIFTSAEKDGRFEHLPHWSNPFRVGFDISTMDRESYEPFTVDELNKLFASPVYAEGKRPTGGRGEAAFWFPLLALYTGARRTELAQLKVGDVRESDGIWFIDFNDAGEGQNLKNLSSARSVPIHRQLIGLGFLDYIRERAGRVGEGYALWPGFEPPVMPKAKAWTKWFGRYLGLHVVDRQSKTFHSFRHTFKRTCREAGISEEIHHAFTGHVGGGVGRSYGRVRRSDGIMDRGVSLERLKAELDRLVYTNLKLPRSH
jgi:integrase